jgi:hypothetical protein
MEMDPFKETSKRDAANEGFCSQLHLEHEIECILRFNWQSLHPLIA